jgi:hypothetical protein
MKLRPAQQKYRTSDRELLVIYEMTYFRLIVEEFHFTNHKPITYAFQRSGTVAVYNHLDFVAQSTTDI